MHQQERHLSRHLSEFTPRLTVEVEIVDGAYLFEGEPLPSERLTFRVRNRSATGASHGFYLGRLAPGVSEEDVRRSEPGIIERCLVDAFLEAGGPAQEFVVETLEPGRYAILCLFGDSHRDIVHFQDGMMRLFTVE